MFLETITWMNNDVLVPINRIKHLTLSYKKDWEIRIVTDDGDWEEHFDEYEDKARKRYEMIKSILKAK